MPSGSPNHASAGRPPRRTEMGNLHLIPLFLVRKWKPNFFLCARSEIRADFVIDKRTHNVVAGRKQRKGGGRNLVCATHPFCYTCLFGMSSFWFHSIGILLANISRFHEVPAEKRKVLIDLSLPLLFIFSLFIPPSLSNRNEKKEESITQD